MTRKIYKSAMGKTVDMGALLLQNEQVRAVGNMGVNAVGDLVDSGNRVIDQRNRQVQRQYKRQTNVADTPIATSNISARKMQDEQRQKNLEPDVFMDEQQDFEEEMAMESASDQDTIVPAAGGLAAAIARNREIKQELEKTRKQRLQEQGIKKL